MTDHTDLIARLRDFAEESHANRCLADAACTCGHDVSRVALAHEAATALEALEASKAAERAFDAAAKAWEKTASEPRLL